MANGKPGRPSNAELAARRAANGDGGNGDAASIVLGMDGQPIGDAGTVIDPAGLGDGGSAGSGDSGPAGNSEPRKRGRPAGKGKKAASPINISGIELLLYTTHNLLAAKTSVPELELDKAEATLLATAIADVAQHYNWLSKVSAEQVAWANLAQTVAAVYAPRYMTYRMRKSMEKKTEG